MIDERHHSAAAVLARNGTYSEAAAAAGVSIPTIARWKRDGEFRSIILRYSDPLRQAARTVIDPASADFYKLIPQRESQLLGKLEAIVEQLGQVVSERIEMMDKGEIEDIPVRLLPSFVKAFSEGVKHLQDSHDRLSGYSIVIDELTKLKDESNLN